MHLLYTKVSPDTWQPNTECDAIPKIYLGWSWVSTTPMLKRRTARLFCLFYTSVNSSVCICHFLCVHACVCVCVCFCVHGWCSTPLLLISNWILTITMITIVKTTTHTHTRTHAHTHTHTHTHTASAPPQGSIIIYTTVNMYNYYYTHCTCTWHYTTEQASSNCLVVCKTYTTHVHNMLI